MSTLNLFYEDGKKIKLLESDEIYRGGEGRLIPLRKDNSLIAKIYLPDIKPICTGKFDYLKKLPDDLFIKPMNLIYDKDKKIVGYVMQHLKNSTPLAAAFNKNFCIKNLITTIRKQKIANQIIKAVNTAHLQQIVIGDLNQYNILLDKYYNVKFIDVDSYQTPNSPHTGILLDEIRDFLYPGVISEKTDYYSLSVLLFYLFTYTHPFKGIHEVFKTIQARVINRSPVFKADKKLKVPKCYQALQNKNLIAQFEKLYVAGDRFLVSMKKVDLKAIVSVKPTILKSDQLTITALFENLEIIDAEFSDSYGYIETIDNFIITKSVNKGRINDYATVKKSEAERIIISDENLFLLKDENLFVYNTNKHLSEIKNIIIDKNSKISQYGNILIVINQNVMSKIWLNDLHNHSLRNTRTEVFGQSFHLTDSFHQYSGGLNRIMYATKSDIATVKIDKPVKHLYQKGENGCVQYIENGEVQNRLFKINGLNIRMGNEKLETPACFALSKNDGQSGYIFMPVDNAIEVFTTELTKISELKCNLISHQSILFHTNAGIVAFDDGKLYLINKR